jgi:hypothetical protein
MVDCLYMLAKEISLGASLPPGGYGC